MVYISTSLYTYAGIEFPNLSELCIHTTSKYFPTYRGLGVLVNVQVGMPNEKETCFFIIISEENWFRLINLSFKYLEGKREQHYKSGNPNEDRHRSDPMCIINE